jgi:antitoxin component YwqK of YwqJK toxin-antitoxin module
MRVTVREDDKCDPLWPNDDYTGQWIIEWPSGALKYECYYIGGMPHGKCVSLWENGQIAQKGEYCNGSPIGTWEDFYEDGVKFKETLYEDSSNFIEKWLDSTGKIIKTTTFKNGLEVTN